MSASSMGASTAAEPRAASSATRGRQPREIERRGQVVRRCEAAPRLGAVADTAVGAGDEHDRRRARFGRLSQLVGEGEAVAVRQPGVDDDHVGQARAHASLGPGALGLGVELEAGVAQRGPDLPLQLGVAFDDQDVPRHLRAAV